MRAWAEMSQEQLEEELSAGNDEAQRRIDNLLALIGGRAPSGKPGRPPKNAYRRAGEGQESQDEDAANGAAS